MRVLAAVHPALHRPSRFYRIALAAFSATLHAVPHRERLCGGREDCNGGAVQQTPGPLIYTTGCTCVSGSATRRVCARSLARTSADLSMAPCLSRRCPMRCGARVVIIGFVGFAPHCPCLTDEFGFGKRIGRAPCCSVCPVCVSAVPVDSSDKTLAARVHLRLVLLRLYGCGAHVCKNPGRNTRSTAGWALHHFIILVIPRGLLGCWC